MKKITTIIKDNQKIDKQVNELIESKEEVYYEKEVVSKKDGIVDDVDTVYVQGYEGSKADTNGMLFTVGLLDGSEIDDISFEELTALKVLLNKIL
jgi:hypothetical protein